MAKGKQSANRPEKKIGPGDRSRRTLSTWKRGIAFCRHRVARYAGEPAAEPGCQKTCPGMLSQGPKVRWCLCSPCSEILVSADGKFVYAGNRLHDSIGIFSVGPNGDLTYLGEEWTRGDYPRNFNFDPTGRFLYCCNQRADNIAVFQVNRKAGGLNFTGDYTPVGNPSHIVFLDLAKVD